MNERQLREMLAELAPASPPTDLLARVEAIPSAVAVRPTTRWLPDLRLSRRTLAFGLIIAAILLTLAAVAIGSRRPPEVPPIGGVVVIPNQGQLLVVDMATGAAIESSDPRGVGGLAKPGTAFFGTYNRVRWSLDGRTLAGFNGDDLNVVDALTGDVAVLTSIPGCRQAPYPCDLAYSPDGRTIAVTNYTELTLVDVATGQKVLARRLGGGIGSPSWSPDGRLVAVSMQGAIDLLDREGTIARRFTIEGDPEFAPVDLAFSPDGERLGFLRYDLASDDSSDIQFVTVRPDGTDERVVATVGNCFCLGWGPPGFTWSPDGQHVAFVTLNFPGAPRSTGPESALVDSTGLYVGNSDGTGLRRIRGDVQGGSPAWQPMP